MQRMQQRTGGGNWLWVILLVVLANVVQAPTQLPALVKLSRGTLGQRSLWIGIYLLGFLLVVALAAWRYHQVAPQRTYQRLTGADWRLMLYAYIFIVVVEEGLNLVNWLVYHQSTTANNQAIIHTIQQSPVVYILMSITAICLSPFLEEFTFRGILMDGCLPQTGFWVPVLVSAVAFSLVHVNTTLASWLVYAVMGGAFAFVYQKTGKLQSTIIMHAVNNLLAMGLLWVTLK